VPYPVIAVRFLQDHRKAITFDTPVKLLVFFNVGFFFKHLGQIFGHVCDGWIRFVFFPYPSCIFDNGSDQLVVQSDDGFHGPDANAVVFIIQIAYGTQG